MFRSKEIIIFQVVTFLFCILLEDNCRRTFYGLAARYNLQSPTEDNFNLQDDLPYDSETTKPPRRKKGEWLMRVIFAR